MHQIRNSLKYIASKDQKAFIKDLKLVYKAINKSVAEDALLKLSEKWGAKYGVKDPENIKHNMRKLLDDLLFF